MKYTEYKSEGHKCIWQALFDYDLVSWDRVSGIIIYF